MKTPFSKVFMRLRKDAGFETAYQFFHKNGGAKVFKCSFQNYLKIEDGTHLPKPERLQLLYACMRSPLKSHDLKEFIKAYLETWFKSADLAKWIVNSLQDAIKDDAVSDPGTMALNKLSQQNKVHISIEEHKVIHKNPASYWCFTMLSNSKDPLKTEDFTTATHIPRKEIESALKELCKHKIIKCVKNDEYISRLIGANISLPTRVLQDPSVKGKSSQYHEMMLKKRGSMIGGHITSGRVDLDKLNNLLPHLAAATKNLKAYTTSEKKDRSAYVLVQAVMYKLFDY
ncbi:hypothetical protein ACFL6Y_02185 [Elusimicrobiota bacterium]